MTWHYTPGKIPLFWDEFWSESLAVAPGVGTAATIRGSGAAYQAVLAKGQIQLASQPALLPCLFLNYLWLSGSCFIFKVVRTQHCFSLPAWLPVSV